MGSYLELGAVKTWYEEAGDAAADRLVLLHGGLSDARGWAGQVPPLSEHYRVLVPDRRGHGLTPDIAGPMTYEAMADDTIAFIETVAGGPAHLAGWSDGGNVALLVALKRPDLVRRQVVIGSNFHYDGLIPGTFDMGPDPDAPDVAMFKAMYESGTADDPADWPEFFAKTMRMWAEGPTLTVDDIARITTPTLVTVGDDELIFLAHTVALYEALQDGQLAVVPGTSHMLPFEKPAALTELIVNFLAETAPPSTILPVHRSTK